MDWEAKYRKLATWIIENFGDCKGVAPEDRAPDCFSCQAMALLDAPAAVKETELDAT